MIEGAIINDNKWYLRYLYQETALGAKRASKKQQLKRRCKKHGGSFGMGELFWSGDEIL